MVSLEVVSCTISSRFGQKLVQHVKNVYSAGYLKLVENPNFGQKLPNIWVFGQIQVSSRIHDFTVLHKFLTETGRNSA